LADLGPDERKLLAVFARKPKAKPRPKLTDAERHKRFVEMAREVQASEDAKDFEKAFDKVVPVKSPPAKKK
jgi:hypothetical protein